MKFTVKKKIDCLGRIVLPVDIRDAYGIKYCDAISITLDGEKILLKRATEKGTKARRIDKLGRMVIPEAMRESLRTTEGDLLLLAPDDDGIYISKNKS